MTDKSLIKKRTMTINGIRYRYIEEDQFNIQRHPSLQHLQQFATQITRKFTDRPIKVVIGDLPKKDTYWVVAKGYTNTFYPTDKQYKDQVLEHTVVLDRSYYAKYKNDPLELKQAVIHELAHLFGERQLHNSTFRKTARKLGADDNHLRRKWD